MMEPIYIDILKNELVAKIKKFGFDLVNPNKFYFKYYAENDPRHKPYYTSVAKLLILLTKVLILILSKNCGFI